MDFGLQGKVAIVTGSSDGIGYATADALAQEGVRIVLCARREALLAEARDTIVKKTGAEVLAVPCDVQQLPDVQRLVTADNSTLRRHPYTRQQCRERSKHAVHDVDDAKWHQMLEGKAAQLHPSDTRGRASYAEGWLGAESSVSQERSGWQPTP